MKLKEFAIVKMGQSPKGETYNSDGNGMPFLQGRKTFGRIYPTIDTWTTNPIKTANNGDILMSVRAPVGDMNFANQEICIGRGLCSITAKNGRNKYLYYVLLNSINDLKQRSTGTVFDAINRNDLENLEISVHSDEDQIKIEKILNDIDEKIELNDKTNIILQKLNNNIYKEQIDNIKSNYTDEFFKNLDDIVIINMRGLSPSYTEKGIPVINQSCIRNGIIHEEKIQYHDLNKKVRNDYHYKPYDILINSMGVGTLGRISQVGDLKKDYLIHSCVTVIRANEEIISKFILGQEIISIQNYIENMAQGSTGQTSLSNKELGKIKLFVPPKEIQNKVSALFKHNIDMITNNLLENENLIKLRDTLLPRLINNEIDLSNIEI